MPPWQSSGFQKSYEKETVRDSLPHSPRNGVLAALSPDPVASRQQSGHYSEGTGGVIEGKESDRGRQRRIYPRCILVREGKILYSILEQLVWIVKRTSKLTFQLLGSL